MILIWNLNKENDAYTIVGEIHLFLGANVHACMQGVFMGKEGDIFNMIGKRPKNKVVMQLYERLVKSFKDVIVLKELENGNPICGHDIRALIHKRFHFLVSSGTIYSLLYSMERNGLIEGMMTGKKRVYRLTEKGKETLKDVSESNDKIPLFIKSILGE